MRCDNLDNPSYLNRIVAYNKSIKLMIITKTLKGAICHEWGHCLMYLIKGYIKFVKGIEIIDYEEDDGYINITMQPNDHNKVKDVVEKIIPEVDYEIDQIGMFPKEKTTLEGEDLEVFKKLYTMIDDIDDVTEIYHNVDNYL